MRAFTSISCGPVDVYLHSTWKTPSENPSASTQLTARSFSSRCFDTANKDGHTPQVSLKYGSTVGPLSVTAAYRHWPSDITKSTSTSLPSRYCSISTDKSTTLSAATPKSVPSAWASAPLTTTSDLSSDTTSRYEGRRSLSVTTFFTPRDAAPEIGFSTRGKPTCPALFTTSASERMRAFLGTGRP